MTNRTIVWFGIVVLCIAMTLPLMAAVQAPAAGGQGQRGGDACRPGGGWRGGGAAERVIARPLYRRYPEPASSPSQETLESTVLQAHFLLALAHFQGEVLA